RKTMMVAQSYSSVRAHLAGMFYVYGVLGDESQSVQLKFHY
ncbi:MAG: hypothetical protein RLZZ24_368, partial [Pseudomonadota bacterium]